MTHTTRLGLAALCAALAGPALLSSTAHAGWEQDVAQARGSNDSSAYHAAVKAIDPADKKARKFLYKVLEAEAWYIREAAAATLASATGEALEDVEKQLLKGKPLVQEGIALGFGDSKNPERIPVLLEALRDKDFMVRRSVVLALQSNHDTRSIPALIEVWEKEKDPRLTYRYHEALQAITGEDIAPVVEDWKNWFKGAGDGFVPPSRREKKDGEGEAGAGPAEPTKGGTVLRDVDMSWVESGNGGPLFVLPEYGYNKEYLIPSMKALEKKARIFYIDLPPIANFKNLQSVGGTGLVEYPIDKLVDAFDELRKQKKQKRIAILAHGISGWIAMSYAKKYPEHVSHLVLVSTWTGGTAWGKGRDRIEADGKQRGDLEQEHFAQSLLVDMQTGKPTYEPRDQADGEALMRMSWSTYFADRRNGLAAFLYPEVQRPMGSVLIPMGFNITKEKLAVPTLIIHGRHSLWTDKNDMRMLGKAFPNSIVIEAPSSNMFPMLEDYKLFTKQVQSFFKKFKFRSGR